MRSSSASDSASSSDGGRAGGRTALFLRGRAWRSRDNVRSEYGARNIVGDTLRFTRLQKICQLV